MNLSAESIFLPSLPNEPFFGVPKMCGWLCSRLRNQRKPSQMFSHPGYPILSDHDGSVGDCPDSFEWTNFAKKWGGVESRYTSQSDVRHRTQRKWSPHPPCSVLSVSFIKPSCHYTTQTFSTWFWKAHGWMPFSQICCLGSLRSPLFLFYFTLSMKLMKE